MFIAVFTGKAPEQGFGAMAEKNNGSFSDGNAPGAGTSSRRAQPWNCSICKADREWDNGCAS